MSLILESVEHEQRVEELLTMMVMELKLLNARVEEGFKTGVSQEDIEDGD